jgi:chromosome segregation ATPase
MELLIKEENNKSRRLQRSIDALDAEKNDVTNILNVVCSKLSIPVKDLADKLDDLLLEMSDAKGTVATLNVDLATTKAELTNKSHESHQLALDNDHLKKMLALTKSQVKETETDASDQNEKARSVIACLEQTLACKEQEWTETRNEITEIQAEKQRLLTNLNESKDKCEQLTSHLEDIQSELATSKNK